MPLTPELRRAIDRIRDYLFAGGYSDPAHNAEQLSFLIYFYMFEAAYAARVRAARRPGAKQYAGAFVGEWTLQNPRNARQPGSGTVPRETLRWSDWPNALNGERLVSWVRDFPFHAGIAAEGVTDFIADARLVIDEPTVLSQAVSHVNDLHLEQVDAGTKGDLFEHVLRQIRQAGHVIRAMVQLVDPRLGETVHDPAAGTAGFLVRAYDHIRLANSSVAGTEEIEADRKTVRRGLGDTLSRAAVRRLHEATLFGNDVDPRMVRLASAGGGGAMTSRGDERRNPNLERGDILFVRTNANPEHIARCPVFRERRLPAYASYLIRARLTGNGAVDPEYVSSALELLTVRQTILRMTRTTAGNYNISIDLLGRIRIPVPDARLQQRFSAVITRTREVLDTTEVSAGTFLDLSACLMPRLFRNASRQGADRA